jgi:phosphoenolpyruvate carboxylase
VFWVASYDKLLPDRPLTANAVSLLVVAIEPLDIVQVPLLEVVHPAAPQPELCELEDAQSGGRRPEDHLRQRNCG